MATNSKGIVYLVGAGPGDPGLMTLRGCSCLQQAEVVIYDRLVNPCILSLAGQAELIDVGKQPNHHTVPQDEINSLLVAHATAGKVVVRLKGGDPFVFGRGGEEAAALAEAGIPFEIIPGVTSAVAVPAYAGIPVTHREHACSVAFITGHRADCISNPDNQWFRSAQAADTLVFLMGVKNLSRILTQIRATGRPAETPVALVQNGTEPFQKTVTGTLADIENLATEIRPPAIIVVGDVVNMREQIRWFDLPVRRPLLGLRVLNTRPIVMRKTSSHALHLDELYGDSLSRRLAELGAEPVRLPARVIVPAPKSEALEKAIQNLASAQPNNPAYDWIIFTSSNAVDFFFDCLFSRDFDLRLLGETRLACVGTSTAETLASYHLNNDFTPSDFTGSKLGIELPLEGGERILLPRSSAAMPEIIATLVGRGAQVDPVTTYILETSTANPEILARLRAGEVDIITFLSPSAVQGLAAQLAPDEFSELLGKMVIACIGPSTAEAVERAGLKPAIIPQVYTLDGLLEAIIAWHQPS